MNNTTVEIRIKKPHKSIKDGQISFPGFVVLSGKNGSGKTHLLEALENPEITEITGENGKLRLQRKLVKTAELEPRQSDANVGGWQSNYQLYNAAKSPRNAMRGQGVPRLGDKLTGQFGRTVKKIIEYTDKDINGLTEDDFKLHSPVDDASSESDPFSQNVEAILNRYADKLLENELRELDQLKGRGDGSYLDPKSFIEKFGNPVEEFNALLKVAKFAYHFNQPKVLLAHDRIWNRQQTFQLKLIDDLAGNEINLSDLSSGEKVILSLIFAKYNSNKDCDFPQVVLLDEPDAYLHPSMIRQFIDVVTEVFVNRGVNDDAFTHNHRFVAGSIVVCDGSNRPMASKDQQTGIAKCFTRWRSFYSCGL